MGMAPTSSNLMKSRNQAPSEKGKMAGMTLFEYHFRSQALNLQTTASILAPDDPGGGPFHVMFLLHGYSDDHTAWLRRTSIERYVEGLPLIVVMPEGGHGFYANAQTGYAYGTAIGEELPRLIEGWFPTKRPWCVTGLSMGGYGASRLALTDPVLFASAASHSGALLAGAKASGGLDLSPIFGPDPAGSENDLLHLARGLRISQRPAMRIDCGTDDFLIEDNREFHRELTQMGFKHVYKEFPGDHNWAYWDIHVQEAISFHRRSLKF
jgi:S-formylglutathione hydrolase FrmB